MIRRSFAWSLSILIVVVLFPFPHSAQTRRRTPVQTSAPILERNIRAELSFLASDAMQGRGSGTNYERIAAEYIGSQFRQFGLEPAGDADSSGNKDFVQRVVIESTRFSGPPSLTATAGANAKTWQFGQDFLVSFVRATKITGDLQVIAPSGTPAKGAVVVFKTMEGGDRERQEAI